MHIKYLSIFKFLPSDIVTKYAAWCTPMFIAVLFTIANIWKQTKCPSVDEWIKQLWYIYTMEYYLAIKKKKNLPFLTAWMGTENIMLSEINQPEKDKYCMISIICGIEWSE